MEPELFSGALVVTGGGTGGHYFPAIALAEGARRRWAELPIVFVGARRGIEAKKLPETAWPFVLLEVEGFLGRSLLKAAASVWKLWKAAGHLKTQWKRHRPQAVIATGGYGAAPAILAARSLKIPYFLHESNAEPGWLVRLAAARAQRVWCGMAAAQARLPNASTRVVGTPVREAFLRSFAPLESLKAPFQLLVLGGSGGARAVNEAMLGFSAELLDRFPGWTILHQTGDRDFDTLKERPRPERHRLQPFIEAVDAELEGSALVVSRSGASTCAELKACGRPAVLVPFPQSAADHQRMNARAKAEEHRAVMVEQGEGFSQRLFQTLADLMGDAEARQRLSHPEANDAVQACLEDLAESLARE